MIERVKLSGGNITINASQITHMDAPKEQSQMKKNNPDNAGTIIEMKWVLIVNMVGSQITFPFDKEKDRDELETRLTMAMEK